MYSNTANDIRILIRIFGCSPSLQPSKHRVTDRCLLQWSNLERCRLLLVQGRSWRVYIQYTPPSVCWIQSVHTRQCTCQS